MAEREEIDTGPAHFVTFRLEPQGYAFPLAHVERALRMVAVTTVPQAPAWVAGVVNFHGQVIPVVDLRRQLGHPVRAFQPDDRLLVVSARERMLALVVDQVGQVLSLPAAEVAASAEPLSRSRPLSAVVREGEELILVLDPARLLPAEAVDWQFPGELPAAHLEDDLTALQGIGPVYAAKLKAAAIGSFRALAESTAQEIALVLGLAEGRLPTIQGWIDQAAQVRIQQEHETNR